MCQHEFLLVLLVTATNLHLSSTQRVRCMLPDEPHGQYSSPDQIFLFNWWVSPGSRVQLACDPGYMVVLGWSEAKCLPSGFWSMRLGRCSNDPLTTTTSTTTPKPRILRPEIIPMAKDGNYSMMETLINNYADVNFRDSNKWTPLMWAIFERNPSVALLLLEEPSLDVNAETSKGSTALHFAIKYDQLSVARAILAKKVDVNKQNGNKVSPLMIAAHSGLAAIVKTLIEKEAKLNLLGKFNETALMLAVGSSQLESVRALLDAGADVNLKNSYGDTALMLAVRNGYDRIVEVLLDRGANINARNNKDQSPLVIADENGRPEIATLLEVRGAKTDSSFLPII